MIFLIYPTSFPSNYALLLFPAKLPQNAKRLKAICLESLFVHFMWWNWYVFRVRKTDAVIPPPIPHHFSLESWQEPN